MRWLRAPLLHFLVLGLALFLLYDKVSGDRGGSGRRIVVGDATVAGLSASFERAWQRPATPAELRALVDDYVRDEMLFREGQAMGLARDDAVIRQRVLQKLQVLAEDSVARSVAPTDEELRAYLKANAARYAQPADIAFEQVMFDPARRGDALDADIAAALARLRAGADPGAMGDSALLPERSPSTPVDLLARNYGARFADTLAAAPIGTWSGPVASGYGVHLVRVSDRTPARMAGLDELRGEIARDWENDRRSKAIDHYLAQVRPKYDVVIEATLPGGATAAGDR